MLFFSDFKHPRKSQIYSLMIFKIKRIICIKGGTYRCLKSLYLEQNSERIFLGRPASGGRLPEAWRGSGRGEFRSCVWQSERIAFLYFRHRLWSRLTWRLGRKGGPRKPGLAMDSRKSHVGRGMLRFSFLYAGSFMTSLNLQWSVLTITTSCQSRGGWRMTETKGRCPGRGRHSTESGLRC